MTGKNTSKAEEIALEAYPVKEEWVGNQYGGPEDVNKISREKYTEGYRQAEKDLLENEHEQSWRLQLKEIEIPFGAKDSELCGWEYTIPEGMEATIVDNKIVVKKKESEDERVRKELLKHLKEGADGYEPAGGSEDYKRWLVWFEKQGWSEWDEKIYNLLYEEYKNLAYYSHSREKAEDIPGEVLGWLKSLKNRVLPQPKQEWSEEDDVMLNSFLHKVEVCDLLTNKENVWIVKKLKFLKDRYTWKPTDAQIASLTIACDRNDRIGFDLTQLLNDLKKLKG